ncbi:MAG: hypothetical protein RR988_05215 [Clostridia bacterium]
MNKINKTFISILGACIILTASPMCSTFAATNVSSQPSTERNNISTYNYQFSGIYVPISNGFYGGGHIGEIYNYDDSMGFALLRFEGNSLDLSFTLDYVDGPLNSNDVFTVIVKQRSFWGNFNTVYESGVFPRIGTEVLLMRNIAIKPNTDTLIQVRISNSALTGYAYIRANAD